MIFNSLFFIFCFFPLSILLYYLMPTQIAKNIVLVILSLLFYSWSNPVTLFILVISIAWNYISALEISSEENTKKKNIIVGVSIGFNILILCIYKYLDFMTPFEIPDLIIPMGLSFFTFSSISYLVDVYTNKVSAQKNILLVTLYISFFGKISMGPIVAYHDMENQLAYREISRDKFSSGMVLFLKGMVKKVLLADQFSLVFSSLQGNTSVLGAWFLSISYMLQIYFDFSGYSDMAIGIGSVFGFDFPVNFDHPYIAKSIQDFWHRWHISLSRWFRDYLYIPLGGNRVTTPLYIRNILIVWLCTGIWHGANWTFIIWGLYYALFLLLEKFFLRDVFSKMPGMISHIYVLLVVLFGWVFFFSPSLTSAFQTILTMFGIQAQGFVNDSCLFVLTSHILLFVLGLFFVTPIYDRLQIIFYNRFKTKAIYITTALYIFFFIFCIAFMVGSSYQSFLYFAF